MKPDLTRANSLPARLPPPPGPAEAGGRPTTKLARAQSLPALLQGLEGSSNTWRATLRSPQRDQESDETDSATAQDAGRKRKATTEPTGREKRLHGGPSAFSAPGATASRDVAGNPAAAARKEPEAVPFDFRRGDLIYGLADARKNLFARICPSEVQKPDGKRLKRDTANVTYVNHAMSCVVDAVVSETSDELFEDFSVLDSGDSDDASSDERDSATATNRLTRREAHQSSLSDSQIDIAFRNAYRGINSEEDLTEFLSETAAAKAGNAQQNMIRLIYQMSEFSNRFDGRYDIPKLKFVEDTRALQYKQQWGQEPPSAFAKGTFSARVSKMPILGAALPGTTHHIHFALDSVDMEAVVRKTGETGNSHTACELRAAHRLGAAVEGRIHYYANGQPCPAPWVADPELWSERQPKHLQNFSRLLPPRPATT